MRITGGIYRSRPLCAPRGQLTRPTSDRVREALFGLLDAAGALENARVLDLYAGTGALSLEALSRGAAHATLVESSRAALDALHENVRQLGLTARTLVVPSDVERATRRLAESGPFDLAFADPPWAQVDSGRTKGALEKLAASRVFAEHALVVLEHSARSPPPTVSGLELRETRRYGDTALALYKTAILGPSALHA